MYADVVLGVDHHVFEDMLGEFKEENGLRTRHRHHRRPVARADLALQGPRGRATGDPFPQDPTRLWGAIGAVFPVWQSARAITYRKLNDIPDDWGTAVNVQAMVFGNMGDHVRHRCRVHPQSVHRRQGALWRVSRQRPGRGRGGRHPHAANITELPASRPAWTGRRWKA
jgi:phosphoenolpyruvate synthase/pyruvate phosphate dikinase